MALSLPRLFGTPILRSSGGFRRAYWIQRKLMYKCLHCRWVKLVAGPLDITAVCTLWQQRELPARSDLSLHRFWGQSHVAGTCHICIYLYGLEGTMLVPLYLQFSGDTCLLKSAGSSLDSLSQDGFISWSLTKCFLDKIWSVREKCSTREKMTLSGESGYRWSRLSLWVQRLRVKTEGLSWVSHVPRLFLD